MAAAHIAPNPHDAEEQLRPLLGRLADTTEHRERIEQAPDGGIGEYLAAHIDESLATKALADRALQMLGVTR